jgi:hypothetical protein
MPIAIADGNRFDGDFTVAAAAGQQTTPDENNFIARTAVITGDLAADDAADPPADGNTLALRVARKEVRKRFAAQLREQARLVSINQIIPNIAADNLLVIKGKYRRDIERFEESLFVVRERLDNANLAVGVSIRVAAGLPPPNDIPSGAKEELYTALDSAEITITTACQRMLDRINRSWRTNAAKERERTRVRQLQDRYIKKLGGIGRVGLEGPQTALGKLALTGLRNEFVAQEAGRIKNAYIQSLGVASAVTAVAFIIPYVLISINNITSNWWHVHKAFLLAAAGAAIGTWLSFSIRRVQLSFDDLAVLEEDRLDPGIRVIFVVGLTMVACLLFWTGIMNLEIGNLKTKPETFMVLGSVAFLVGVFSGIAERALATAISGRAAAFVRGLAGGG